MDNEVDKVYLEFYFVKVSIVAYMRGEPEKYFKMYLLYIEKYFLQFNEADTLL